MSKFRTQDGIELHYLDWSHGRPLLFCHGWLRHSSQWQRVMFNLAKAGFRCIALDRRGHGRSDQSWAGYGLGELASDLSALLDHLQLHDVAVIGSDLGALEALSLIEQDRSASRITALTMISPPLCAPSGGTPQAIWDGLATALRADPLQLATSLANGPFFGFNRPATSPMESVIKQFLVGSLEVSMPGAVHTFELLRNGAETSASIPLELPVLHLHGEDDQLFPAACVQAKVKALAPSSQLRIIESGPHGLVETCAGRIEEELLSFLRQVKHA